MLRTTSGIGMEATKPSVFGSCHLAGDDAGEIGALVGAHVIGAQVGAGLEAGGVLPLDVRKFLGQPDHRFHVAERRAEDHLVALGGQVTEHALGIGFSGTFST